VLCGFSLRIQRSSRIANSTISSPKEILVAFIKRPFLASSAMTKHPVSRSTGVLSPGVDRLPARSLQTVGRRLAEKPKIGKLQMDWLRSEDLKEEKNVTTPVTIIAG